MCGAPFRQGKRRTSVRCLKCAVSFVVRTPTDRDQVEYVSREAAVAVVIAVAASRLWL
jgi:hypothetical protein